jgi:thymidylate synthase (FAD)
MTYLLYAGLIKYLVKNYHTSPFESVTLTFDIKAPIFVFRQWHRHRTWAYNEISGRYSNLPEEFYIPEVSQITHQSTSNKQMRTDEIHPKAEEHQRVITAACELAFSAYKAMIADGVPRELARGVLPLNTYSHMFGTVNLLNLMKFIKLRSHEHAQYEIRVYSDAMLELARSVAPVATAAFEEFWL